MNEIQRFHVLPEQASNNGREKKMRIDTEEL